MNCFPCFQFRKSLSKREHGSPSAELVESKAPDTKKQKPGNENRKEEPPQADVSDIAAQAYTFRELATATRNFRQECLLGEGGFGRVYKGMIPSTGQVVAVKQLDRNGMQGNKEFLAEVSTLSKLNHPNLVNLIGYCADGDQRLLVYEYMSGGSVQDHLLDVPPGKEPLDWFTRMKIAYGAAQGLEYLHDKADPPIIYRDLKPSNILLNEEFAPKLSDFGLANLGPAGDRTPVPSRVMGTYGYSAPEYVRGDQLTLKSDVYSFGVILLELITGRRAIDTTKPIQEQNLVTWAQPIFREPKRFPDMADPVLNRRFPEKDLNQAVAIAAMCLQEESGARPLMSDVVTTLSFLSMSTESLPSPLPPSTPSPEEKAVDHDQQRNEDNDSSDSDHDGKGSESDPDESGSDQEDKEHEDHDKDDERGEEDEGQTSDKDYTDSEDGESEDRDEEKDSDDGEYDANESKNWGTNSMTSAEDTSSSSRKSSSRKSSSRMSSSSRKSSDYNASLRHKSSGKSHQSLKSKSSKRSKSRSSSSSSSSEASQDGTASLRHKSSRISRTGSNSSDGNDSRKGSDEGSVYSSRGSDRLEHTDSEGSDNGSVYSS